MIAYKRLLLAGVLFLILTVITAPRVLADSSSLGRYADGVYPVFDTAVMRSTAAKSRKR